jgi:hypothetical protein
MATSNSLADGRRKVLTQAGRLELPGHYEHKGQDEVVGDESLSVRTPLGLLRGECEPHRGWPGQ